MKIKIKVFVFNPFQENTYVLSDDTNEAIIIDPGAYEPFEKKELRDWIEQYELKIKFIYNTHCHIDHVLGNDFCKEQFKAPLLIPENENQIYKAVKTYADSYGIFGYREAEVDNFINEDHIIRFGNTELKSMWIPGHAPGHLVFYNVQEKICIGGDVLFQRSIGRTDLPGGDHDTLISNIRQKLFKLDEDMKVYPGHGLLTTIGEEKKYNPFVGINA
ncbi:MAG: MBL fold metallo-hydrolase [Cytophagales bacterium]